MISELNMVQYASRRAPQTDRDIELANQSTRHALGGLIPQRSWMTSGPIPPPPATPRRTAARRRSGATESLTSTRSPRSPRSRRSSLVAQVPNGPTHDPRAPAGIASGTTEARALLDGLSRGPHIRTDPGDAGPVVQPVPSITTADTTTASEPPQPSASSAPETNYVGDVFEMRALVAAVSTGLPVEDLLTAGPVHVPYLQHKLLCRLHAAKTTPVIARHQDLDDATTSNGHRLGILEDAVNDQDYYFLLLHQMISLIEQEDPQRRSSTENDIIRLKDFYAGSGELADGIKAFCRSYPLPMCLLREHLPDVMNEIADTSEQDVMGHERDDHQAIVTTQNTNADSALSRVSDARRTNTQEHMDTTTDANDFDGSALLHGEVHTLASNIHTLPTANLTAQVTSSAQQGHTSAVRDQRKQSESSQMLSSEKVLPSRTGLQKFQSHLHRSASKIKSSWPRLLQICNEAKTLPLAQDLLRNFGVSSRTLQQAMFGVILDGFKLGTATISLIQDHFIESQARLVDQRLISPEEARRRYDDYHRCLTDPAGAGALGPESPVLHSELFSISAQQPKIAAELFVISGAARTRPGSFRANAERSSLARSPDAQVFVSSLRMGPVSIPARPFVQTYTFGVSQADFATLATKQPGPEGPVSHFNKGSTGFRLRICPSKPSQKWTISEWLRQPATWPNWLYATLNRHILEPPTTTSGRKTRPYDLSEVILPGPNTLILHLNRATTDPIPNLAVAIETTSGVSTEHIIAAVQREQTLPSPAVLSHLRRRLTPRDEDDDIVMLDPVITISLLEPFSNSKIFDVPARGRECRHDQAFDLRTFLESRPLKGEYSLVDMRCPICGVDARPEQMVIDGFLVEVRKELERRGLLAAAKAILVGADGEWKVREEKAEQVKGESEAEGRVVLEIDDDDKDD
ncbi:E3 SUMO-protein ligase pli1 [Sphaceloma murrayae]|uniref:E3 SUMO-protein ligase pli1 n=1 Tax=Sphaceloma murrayae TaxID=2082308 RepID=A0A2K1QTA2_9PEZI|nr:E3 SUMO-protein ligase pli1 [Sphaceloma murrayae]